jgi:hypothetical protein
MAKVDEVLKNPKLKAHVEESIKDNGNRKKRNKDKKQINEDQNQGQKTFNQLIKYQNTSAFFTAKISDVSNIEAFITSIIMTLEVSLSRIALSAANVEYSLRES